MYFPYQGKPLSLFLYPCNFLNFTYINLRLTVVTMIVTKKTKLAYKILFTGYKFLPTFIYHWFPFRTSLTFDHKVKILTLPWYCSVFCILPLGILMFLGVLLAMLVIGSQHFQTLEILVITFSFGCTINVFTLANILFLNGYSIVATFKQMIAFEKLIHFGKIAIEDQNQSFN